MAQQQTPSPIGDSDAPLLAVTASSFADTWIRGATPEDIGDLVAARPHIPAALDAELLRTVQADHGNLRDHDQLRGAVRAAFWSGIEHFLHQ